MAAPGHIDNPMTFRPSTFCITDGAFFGKLVQILFAQIGSITLRPYDTTSQSNATNLCGAKMQGASENSDSHRYFQSTQQTLLE